MPEVQEVFRMATQKVRPDPGFVDRQYDHRRKQERNRKIGALALVAAIGTVAAVLVVRSTSDERQGQPLAPTTPAPTTAAPTQSGVGSIERPPDRSFSRIVEGVRLSFRVPVSGWTAGPIERLPDDSGFEHGSLYISKSTQGPQGAEAVVFWTSFPDGRHADPCANLLPSPAGHASDLAAAVATARGTDLVTGPSDVTVGGRPAIHVVVTVREDVGCDPGFFYTWHDEKWGPFWGATNVGDTISVWILDMDGTLLFMEAETTRQAGSILEREIQQIVGSIRFD
jgi:hypothetical protein